MDIPLNLYFENYSKNNIYKAYIDAKKFIKNIDDIHIHISDNLSIKEQKKNIEEFFESNDPTIAGAIMVKNQEAHIQSSIQSILPFVDELIIMDTGSTDKTISKIKELNNSKIELKEVVWKEDFSLMRNKLISYTNCQWILIIDSDEIFENTIEVPSLKNIFSLLNSIIENDTDIILRIEAYTPDSAMYVLPDRIFKNTSTIKFIHPIHEEINSLCKQKIVLNTKLKMINLGTNNEEIIKFNKVHRYNNLLLKMLIEEQYNPRWIELSSNELIEKAYPDISLEQIFLNHIVINKDIPISKKNIQNHQYVSSILERLIILYIVNHNINEAANLINFCRINYPNNISYIAYNYFMHLKIIDSNLDFSFKSLIFDANQIDEEKSLEVSQKDNQILEALGVKYLFKLERYNEAKHYANNIYEPFAKDLIQKELFFLKKDIN